MYIKLAALPESQQLGPLTNIKAENRIGDIIWSFAIKYGDSYGDLTKHLRDELFARFDKSLPFQKDKVGILKNIVDIFNNYEKSFVNNPNITKKQDRIRQELSNKQKANLYKSFAEQLENFGNRHNLNFSPVLKSRLQLMRTEAFAIQEKLYQTAYNKVISHMDIALAKTKNIKKNEELANLSQKRDYCYEHISLLERFLERYKTNNSHRRELNQYLESFKQLNINLEYLIGKEKVATQRRGFYNYVNRLMEKSLEICERKGIDILGYSIRTVNGIPEIMLRGKNSSGLISDYRMRFKSDNEGEYNQAKKIAAHWLKHFQEDEIFELLNNFSILLSSEERSN